MTTGQHSSLPSFARATLARLFGAEAQQALSGSAGTIEFQTNAAAVGPGLVITINANTFNVRNTGSRILVAAYMSGVAAAAVAGPIQIKRGTFALPPVPPNPPAVSAAKRGRIPDELLRGGHDRGNDAHERSGHPRDPRHRIRSGHLTDDRPDLAEARR